MDVVALLVIAFGAVTVLCAASWVFVSPLGRRGLERRIRRYRIDVRKPITLGGGEGPQMIPALTAIKRRLDIQKATSGGRSASAFRCSDRTASSSPSRPQTV